MISWPKGIYLEASLLYNFPMDVINAEMERLKALSEPLGVSIFIPEISFQEWIPKRKEAIRKYISRVEDGSDKLHKIFDYVPKVDWKKDKESIIEDTETFTKKILDNNGITVIETPKIDLKKLTHMAVNKIKPFEKGGEKGFRDSINLFTVLEHAQNQKDGSHFFITTDKIYKHEDCLKLAKKYCVELIIVSSISDTNSKLEEFIKHVKKVFDTYEKEILKKFLWENADKISEYIKQNGEFTISFFNKDYKSGIMSEIENIDDIKVIGIDSITRGTLGKGAGEGKVKISFMAKTRFNVRVKEIPFSPEPRFKYKEKIPSPMQAAMLTFLASGGRQTLNKTIENDVSIEGSAILKKEKNQKGHYEDKYSDLNLDNVIIE